MQTDQLNGLIALKVVAELRNFRSAAMHLGISASAVSQAIKQLEARLGATLLSRTTRSTSLTEAGEQFLSQAGPALEQILGAMESVGEYGEKPSGLLRINLPRAVFPHFLAPLILSFKKKFPEVAVELYFEDHQSDVVQHGFDAGIRLSDILAKDMVAIKLLGPIRFVMAASSKYLNKVGRPKHPKDLLSADCILMRFGLAGLYDKWEFEQKGKEFHVKVKGSLIINDPLLMRDLARDGAGFIYTTMDSIQDDIKSGKLEVVLNSFAISSAGYYLYYPQRSQVQPKLRAFISHLQEHFASNKS